jgi:hypothetical protein
LARVAVGARKFARIIGLAIFLLALATTPGVFAHPETPRDQVWSSKLPSRVLLIGSQKADHDNRIE